MADAIGAAVEKPAKKPTTIRSFKVNEDIAALPLAFL
jgi:hypothetical protein